MAVPRTKPSVVFSTSLRVTPVVLDWKEGVEVPVVRMEVEIYDDDDEIGWMK